MTPLKSRYSPKVEIDPPPCDLSFKIFSLAEAVLGAEKVSVYDSLDADVIQSYMEFSLASLIYYATKEGATSEQSSRMTAMDNSSKNAGRSKCLKLIIFLNL